ncbi:Protein fam13c [Borealophlyctis nickersoniae]|nr:Protein fam13c [Borealophlyctis nickersoniae]
MKKFLQRFAAPTNSAPSSPFGSPPSQPIFGSTLDALEIPETETESAYEESVPKVLQRFVKFLSCEDALSTEGIFRVAGSAKVVRELREEIERTGDVDFSEVAASDIPAVATLMKQWIRDLKDGIVPTQYVPAFLEAGVSSRVTKNKMTASNLAIIFAPNIFKCPSATAVEGFGGVLNAGSNVGREFIEESYKIAGTMVCLMDRYEDIFDMTPLGSQDVVKPSDLFGGKRRRSSVSVAALTPDGQVKGTQQSVLDELRARLDQSYSSNDALAEVPGPPAEATAYQQSPAPLVESQPPVPVSIPMDVRGKETTSQKPIPASVTRSRPKPPSRRPPAASKATAAPLEPPPATTKRKSGGRSTPNLTIDTRTGGPPSALAKSVGSPKKSVSFGTPLFAAAPGTAVFEDTTSASEVETEESSDEEEEEKEEEEVASDEDDDESSVVQGGSKSGSEVETESGSETSGSDEEESESDDSDVLVTGPGARRPIAIVPLKGKEEVMGGSMQIGKGVGLGGENSRGASLARPTAGALYREAQITFQVLWINSGSVTNDFGSHIITLSVSLTSPHHEIPTETSSPGSTK